MLSGSEDPESIFTSIYKSANGGEYREEREVYQTEKSEVFECHTGRILGVFTEGDEAGKRRDDRARAADIHPDEQCPVILGKFREQDRARDVTYELAGDYRGDESIPIEHRAEKDVNRRDPRHITREDEEGAEGEEQRIIDATERRAVDK